MNIGRQVDVTYTLIVMEKSITNNADEKIILRKLSYFRKDLETAIGEIHGRGDTLIKCYVDFRYPAEWGVKDGIG